MSIWTSFVKIWTVCNCEFHANFLTFVGLYNCFSDLMANIWEEAILILAENLNLGRRYLITPVNIEVQPSLSTLKRFCNLWYLLTGITQPPEVKKIRFSTCGSVYFCMFPCSKRHSFRVYLDTVQNTIQKT